MSYSLVVDLYTSLVSRDKLPNTFIQSISRSKLKCLNMDEMWMKYGDEVSFMNMYFGLVSPQSD